MRRLAIETATEALSLALFEDDICLAWRHELVGRGHAEQLLPRIAALPDGGKVDEILVDVGPGSFTGVRVGLAAARALSFAWGASLQGYGSLALVALAARRVHASAEPITVALTGGHGELFWQRFDAASLTPLTAATSTPIPQLAVESAPPVVYGSGAAAWIAARGAGEAVPLHPDARDTIHLPSALLETDAGAVYGRSADAKTLVERGQPEGSRAS